MPSHTVQDSLARCLDEVTQIRRLADESLYLLGLLSRHTLPIPAANDIIGELRRKAKLTGDYPIGMALISRINQRGQMKRMQADRLITLTADSQEDTQKAAIARDIENLKGIVESAEAAAGIVVDGAIALDSVPM